MGYNQGLVTCFNLLLVLFSKLFQTIDLDQVNSPSEGPTYAGLYLHRCNKEFKSVDNIDIDIHQKLVQLDIRLLTPVSEQLFSCLVFTTRWDIIKVRINIHDLSEGLKQILDNRL